MTDIAVAALVKWLLDATSAKRISDILAAIDDPKRRKRLVAVAAAPRMAVIQSFRFNGQRHRRISKLPPSLVKRWRTPGSHHHSASADAASSFSASSGRQYPQVRDL